MARKGQTVEIAGCKYQFTQLGAVEGKDFFHDLRKVALPALRSLLTGDIVKSIAEGDSQALDQIEGEKLGELLGLVLSLFENMPKQLERDLCSAFARNCKICTAETAGAFIDIGDASVEHSRFDQHFAGEYLALQQWLIAGLRFNFAGFLGGLGSSRAPASPPTPSP